MPVELRGRVSIDAFDLFDDSDAFTPAIYHLGDRVEAVVTASVSRSFVDLNRSPDDLPPVKNDGLVKRVTCQRKPVYIEGKEPGPALMEQLISRYYVPYHREIRESIHGRKLIMGLDCHSMAAVAPAVAPDTGRKRPLICLGNVYGRSCSYKTVQRLAAAFRTAFSLEKFDITVNRPFNGGYITRTYGGNPIPWVQVELNRSLYLAPPWFDRSGLRIDNDRLSALKMMFAKTLELFFRDFPTHG